MGRAAHIGRDAILAAALKIADDQGLDAVTMHAVARRLQVTPMALYRHVASKAALLDGLVECCSPSSRCPCPTCLEEFLAALAAGIRASARRHPAAFAFLLSRPAITPAATGVRDAVHQALRRPASPRPNRAHRTADQHRRARLRRQRGRRPVPRSRSGRHRRGLRRTAAVATPAPSRNCQPGRQRAFREHPDCRRQQTRALPAGTLGTAPSGSDNPARRLAAGPSLTGALRRVLLLPVCSPARAGGGSVMLALNEQRRRAVTPALTGSEQRASCQCPPRRGSTSDDPGARRVGRDDGRERGLQ